MSHWDEIGHVRGAASERAAATECRVDEPPLLRIAELNRLDIADPAECAAPNDLSRLDTALVESAVEGNPGDASAQRGKRGQGVCLLGMHHEGLVEENVTACLGHRARVSGVQRVRCADNHQQPFHSADAGDARGNRMRIVAWIPAQQSAPLLGHRKGSRDWVSRSKRLMSEGRLTGRLLLWRGSWMVASVSP